MSSALVAQFTNVSKQYRIGAFGSTFVQAVESATFDVRRGEVFGLLGPNRAGKTTLVKMLLALCRPTAGEIRRLDRPATDRATLARVGYMHENQSFPRYLTARGLLAYYGALTGLPELAVRRRVPVLLERVGLADRSAEPISGFSKGMVQRLALAQALVNEPELLVLDEPTEGLDLTGRTLLHEIMREQRQRGQTVLLISHVLPEVERVCDRVAVIVSGKIAFTGPVAALLQKGAAAQSLEHGLQELYQKTSP